jgi:hypothetical protein
MARVAPGGWLELAESDGRHCVGLVLLSGGVFGAGLVQLLVGPLGQSDAFSMQVLLLLLMQLMGPVTVALLSTVLLLPTWLRRCSNDPSMAWRRQLFSALPVAPLLMVCFLVAGLLGGVLITPRTDVVGELSEVVRTIVPRELVGALVRCTAYLALPAVWCLREVRQGIRYNRDPADVASGTLLNSFTLVLVLRIFWMVVVEPIHLPRMF